MKDLFNIGMHRNGGYGHPLRFPAAYTVSIHRCICSTTIFGFSAILVVLSCSVYFDSGFGFLGPLKLGAPGSYNSSEGIVVVETAQIKELGGVGDYNSSERNIAGVSRQQKKVGGVGDNNSGEGTTADETARQKQLGGVRDNNGGEGLMVDETGQQKQLGGVGDNDSGDGVMVDETGQQKQLGGVRDNNVGEGLMVDEIGQQKQLGGVKDNNSGEGLVGVKGQKKQLGECDLSVGMWVQDEVLREGECCDILIFSDSFLNCLLFFP